jgi:DNA-binding transcriptional ArsR family regulator
MPTTQPEHSGPIGVAALAALFQLVANPTRAQILPMLGDGEHSVHEIVAEVGHSRVALGHHTTALRLISLIDFRQDGKRHVYALTEAGRAMRGAIEMLGAEDLAPRLRTTAAKVIVELRKGSGDEAMLAALEDAAGQLRATMAGEGQQVAAADRAIRGAEGRVIRAGLRGAHGGHSGSTLGSLAGGWSALPPNLLLEPPDTPLQFGDLALQFRECRVDRLGQERGLVSVGHGRASGVGEMRANGRSRWSA